MTVDPSTLAPESETQLPFSVTVDDTDGDDDDDELEIEDITDDALSALRDMVGPKRVPNGVYPVALIKSSYTEIPASQGRPYLTLTFIISKGPYRGKRIATRYPIV